MLVFFEPVGLVARELWILAKHEGFVTEVCHEMLWTSHGSLANKLRIFARYSCEMASSARAPIIEDGDSFGRIS